MIILKFDEIEIDLKLIVAILSQEGIKFLRSAYSDFRFELCRNAATERFNVEQEFNIKIIET